MSRHNTNTAGIARESSPALSNDSDVNTTNDRQQRPERNQDNPSTARAPSTLQSTPNVSENDNVPVAAGIERASSYQSPEEQIAEAIDSSRSTADRNATTRPRRNSGHRHINPHTEMPLRDEDLATRPHGPLAIQTRSMSRSLERQRPSFQQSTPSSSRATSSAPPRQPSSQPSSHPSSPVISAPPRTPTPPSPTPKDEEIVEEQTSADNNITHNTPTPSTTVQQSSTPSRTVQPSSGAGSTPTITDTTTSTAAGTTGRSGMNITPTSSRLRTSFTTPDWSLIADRQLPRPPDTLEDIIQLLKSYHDDDKAVTVFSKWVNRQSLTPNRQNEVRGSWRAWIRHPHERYAPLVVLEAMTPSPPVVTPPRNATLDDMRRLLDTLSDRDRHLTLQKWLQQGLVSPVTVKRLNLSPEDYESARQEEARQRARHSLKSSTPSTSAERDSASSTMLSSPATRPTFLTGFDPQRYVKESGDEILPAEDLRTRMTQILSLAGGDEFDQLTGEWLLKNLLNRDEVSILWNLYWDHSRKESRN